MIADSCRRRVGAFGSGILPVATGTTGGTSGMVVFGQWFHPGVHEVPMSFADSVRMQGGVELLEASEGCGTSAGKSAGVVSSTGGAGAAIDDVTSPPPRTVASKSAVGSGWLGIGCTGSTT